MTLEIKGIAYRMSSPVSAHSNMSCMNQVVLSQDKLFYNNKISGHNDKVGDVVIVHDDKTRIQWRLALDSLKDVKYVLFQQFQNRLITLVCLSTPFLVGLSVGSSKSS